MKELKVRITLREQMLGSQSANPDIHREFIAAKADDAAKIDEEVAAITPEEIEEEIEKSMTVFPKLEDGTPFLWDYQLKGFFKSACSALNMAHPGSKLTAFKKKIDLLVFVKDRKMPFQLPEGGKIGEMQRPLRGQTAQGERVALAHSETIPAGSTVEATIQVLDDSLMKRVEDWLDYGQFNGLGQWRNARWGSFTWEEIK